MMHITREGRTVAKAIALLDEKGPENWRDRVDLETLDLERLSTCVLAQVYGGSGFSTSLRELRLTSEVREAFIDNLYLPQWRRQLS